MLVSGKTWDVYNEVEAPSDWDEGAEPAYKLWPEYGLLTALVDADMIPYIVGFSQSAEKWEKVQELAKARGLRPSSKKWFKWIAKHKLSFSAIDHADDTVNQWVNGAGCDSALLYLTDGTGNFRFNVAFSRQYKGQKARQKPKPPFFHLIKWHLVQKHNAIVSLTEEADDLMAIEQYQRNQELALDGAKQGSKLAKQLSTTVIVTKDKDLRMIPGWHSNPDIDDGKPVWVNRYGELLPEYDKSGKMTKLRGTGLIFFYAQLLVGDNVDNYTGIPGVGIVRAYEELLVCDTLEELHDAVEVMYYDKYGKDSFTCETWTGKRLKVNYMDMFVQQGRLAFMQTKPNEVWMKKHKLPDPKKWRVDL